MKTNRPYYNEFIPKTQEFFHGKNEFWLILPPLLKTELADDVHVRFYRDYSLISK